MSQTENVQSRALFPSALSQRAAPVQMPTVEPRGLPRQPTLCVCWGHFPETSGVCLPASTVVSPVHVLVPCQESSSDLLWPLAVTPRSLSWAHLERSPLCFFCFFLIILLLILDNDREYYEVRECCLPSNFYLTYCTLISFHLASLQPAEV